MSRYIDAERIKILMKQDCLLQGNCEYELWKQEVDRQVNALPHIELDDYVPRDFHDKTCEAMAKIHQEEIANMVSVVRCKECASYCGDGNKCLWGLLTVDMGYCHHGYRGGDCITDGRKENK